MGAVSSTTQRRAEEFFVRAAIPRRVRDHTAEKRSKISPPPVCYRRVRLDEPITLGTPYPVAGRDISRFNEFGLGIGVYFSQLTSYAIIFFIIAFFGIIGCILYLPDINHYLSPERTGLFRITGSCHLPKEIITTIPTYTCDDNNNNILSTCQVDYQEDCDLPMWNCIIDLIMACCLIIFFFILDRYSKSVKEKLDITIQTAQDYAIIVKNPPKDATNPDEWFSFFSRHGVVKYVTIHRDNLPLMNTILEKYKYDQKLKKYQLQQQNATIGNDINSKIMIASPLNSEHISDSHGQFFLQKTMELEQKLSQLIQQTYPVSRVIITYEYEANKQAALRSLEVPDLFTKLNLHDWYSTTTHRFGKNQVLLQVEEPPEPDDILWENSVDSKPKRFNRFCCCIISLSFLIFTWFIVEWCTVYSSLLVSFVIAFIDCALPMIFEYLVDWSYFSSQTQKQEVLQTLLFMARLLISTIIPYVQMEWREPLKSSFLIQIIQTQITSCFFGTLLSFFDVVGYCMRHYYSRIMSDTPDEYITHWQGTNWSLSDRYTNVMKIIFISLFYSLVLPMSLPIGCIALFLLFLSDRYLLFRKWQQHPRLDARIARWSTGQCILAVLAKIYVSSRFVYSWPMDTAWMKSDTEILKVNKIPSWKPWKLTIRDWMSPSQGNLLIIYQVFFWVLFVIVLWIFFISPFKNFLYRMLFSMDYDDIPTSDTPVPFSSVNGIFTYEPTYKLNRLLYRCSYTKLMLPEHRPPVLHFTEDDDMDLSGYVPEAQQPFVLSTVKFYGDYLPAAATLDMESTTVDDIMVNPNIANRTQDPSPYSNLPTFELTTLSDGTLQQVPRNWNHPDQTQEILTRFQPQVVARSAIAGGSRLSRIQPMNQLSNDELPTRK